MFAGWKMSGFSSPCKKNKTEVKLFNSTDFELALVKLSPKHFCGTRLRQHFQHWYCSWQRCRCRLDKGIPGTLCWLFHMTANFDLFLGVTETTLYWWLAAVFWSWNHLALIVEKLDDAIHQINSYPVDTNDSPNTYPLDSSISGE